MVSGVTPPDTSNSARPCHPRNRLAHLGGRQWSPANGRSGWGRSVMPSGPRRDWSRSSRRKGRRSSGGSRLARAMPAPPSWAASSSSWIASRPRRPQEPAAQGNHPRPRRIHCLNAADGKTLWTHAYDCPYEKVSYPSGPRTTPVVDGDRLFTLGTMGDLKCLKTADGSVVWSKSFPKDLQAPTPAWVGRRISCSTAIRSSRSSAAMARRSSPSTSPPAK